MSAPGRSEFVYVTYIRTTPEKLWAALTDDTDFMKQYWFGTYCESAWTAGSPWKMVQPSGKVSDAGEIVEVEPQRRLVIRWEHQTLAPAPRPHRPLRELSCGDDGRRPERSSCQEREAQLTPRTESSLAASTKRRSGTDRLATLGK